MLAGAKKIIIIIMRIIIIITPIAIETTGAMNQLASELITEIGRRITEVTGEVKESIYLFQQVSVAIQRGKMLCFTGSFVTEDT